MSHICRELGKDPSYMFGGLAQSGMPSAAIGDGTISIMEGDEYKSARWDMRAKFMHYSPTHLLLTAARWDHADIYPTEEDYREAFRTLVGMVPETGVIVRSADEPSIDHVIDNATCAVVTYGMTTDADITYRDVKQSTEGLSFEITIADQSYPVTSPMIGRYVAENIAGCIAMCHVLGCDIQLVIDAIKTFPGIKRRLEKRGQTAAGVPVFDDIAHSPDKARSVLKNLTEIFSGNIYCIYEPNTGNRRPQAMPLYDHAFADADAVIIGRLSRVKIDPNDPDKPVNGEELANQIKKTHERVHYIASDDKLIEFLNTNAASGDAIVFCGSHGFRGMIEQLCIKTPTS
jgi:UDP-N-acetylmuramate: L-alanyl-gamma-D-glutamyl-meso-diaminopimelate ligase